MTTPPRHALAALLLAGVGTSGIACNENAPPLDSRAAAPAADVLSAENRNILNPHAAQPPPAPPSATNAPHALASLAAPPDTAPPPSSLAPGGARATLPPGPKPAAASDATAIPDGAAWTILCTSIAGPGHVEQAKELKTYLLQQTGRKEFRLAHGENESTLFFGFYKTIQSSDPEGRRAKADMAALQGFTVTGTDQSQVQPLKTCYLVPLDAADASGPPEWDLTLKDRDKPFDDADRAFWSVEVEAFTANPRRKEAAVERCREYRGKGIEAYYFHGENTSSVLIGTWKRNAVKEQHHANDIMGPNDVLLYLDKPLPGKVQGDLVTPEGEPIKTMTTRAEIQEPTLMRTLREYPNHLVNYEAIVHVKTLPDGKKVRYEDRSFMVIIPHPTDEEMTARRNTRDRDGDVGFLPPPAPAANTVTSTGNRLRTLQR